MNKSTHKAEVVKIKIEPHPHADKLGVVKVFGYTVCVGLEHWTDGQLAVHIVPDTIVDTRRTEFAYLAAGCKPGEHEFLVKAKKLRQVPSFGILVPAPQDVKEGDDLFEYFGLKHYDPPENLTVGSEAGAAPSCGHVPTYDVDALKRYTDKFVADELVIVTEKIHGASAKFTFHDGNLYAGSKSEWKSGEKSNPWLRALRGDERIPKFCKANPELVVFGEIYGAVQDLKYGCKGGEVKFAAFDLWHKQEQRWLCWNEVLQTLNFFELPFVPTIGEMPFNMDVINALAEGPSLVAGADHIREGVVVKPVVERTDLEIGRVCLKVVGVGYLDRKGK